jgi:hypothetical protein
MPGFFIQKSIIAYKYILNISILMSNETIVSHPLPIESENLNALEKLQNDFIIWAQQQCTRGGWTKQMTGSGHIFSNMIYGLRKE